MPTVKTAGLLEAVALICYPSPGRPSTVGLSLHRESRSTVVSTSSHSEQSTSWRSRPMLAGLTAEQVFLSCVPFCHFCFLFFCSPVFAQLPRLVSMIPSLL